ncbi:MAG: hypothetical protein RIS47_1481, partial [Bacteroidota bacterium]
MKNLTALLFAICVFYNLGFSQQNSPSVDWKRMETPHFEVVFPSNLQGVGQRMANELEHYYMPVSASLEKQPKRISVFLFGQSAVSNGYVQLFPRYSAWYPIPGPDAAMGGQDEWFRSTGIHEFRHVVQFDKANQGMTRFFSRIFGDLIRAGLAWSVPSWFVEGDAVCIETALTHEGRGRLPSFEMPVRASVLTGKKMSYEQAYLG